MFRLLVLQRQSCKAGVTLFLLHAVCPWVCILSLALWELGKEQCGLCTGYCASSPHDGGGGLFIQVSDVEVSSEETALRGTGAREQFIITGWAAITGKRLHKSTPCQHHWFIFGSRSCCSMMGQCIFRKSFFSPFYVLLNVRSVRLQMMDC